MGSLRGGEGSLQEGTPDHEYYLQTRERIGTNRAALSIARKLLRRAHHTLRELGGSLRFMAEPKTYDELERLAGSSLLLPRKSLLELGSLKRTSGRVRV